MSNRLIYSAPMNSGITAKPGNRPATNKAAVPVTPTVKALDRSQIPYEILKSSIREAMDVGDPIALFSDLLRHRDSQAIVILASTCINYVDQKLKQGRSFTVRGDSRPITAEHFDARSRVQHMCEDVEAFLAVGNLKRLHDLYDPVLSAAKQFAACDYRSDGVRFPDIRLR